MKSFKCTADVGKLKITLKWLNNIFNLIRLKFKVMTDYVDRWLWLSCQRENIDERTLGDIFYDYGRSLPDIDITDALNWLIKTINGLVTKLNMNSSVLDTIFDEFIKALPKSLTRRMGNAS